MKNIAVTFLALVFSLTAFSQAKPQLKFDEDTHDFGEIMEENGPVDYKFEFTNLGTAPLIINNVKASCGCTTPGWTREPVMPGKRGYIEARYNPLNRPGSFRKSLTIYSNAEGGSSQVYIQGRVTPKPKSLAETLPTKIGNLKMRTSTLNIGNITNNAEVVKSFDIYNDGDTPINVSSVETPDFISASFEPASIAPASAGKLVVKYDPVKKGELGYVRDYFTVTTNETNAPVKKLSAVATIREHFNLSATELATAPKLKFEKTIIEFGNTKSGEPVNAEFTFVNQGKDDLNIREIKTNCDCTKAEIDSKNLKPGESGKVFVTFNTDGRKGVQHQQITVFSNDPKGSMQMIALRGTVEESE